MPELSCHFSNLGSAEVIHPPQAQVRVTELWPATLSTAFIVGLVILGDKLFFPMIYQSDETEESAVREFVKSLDAQFLSITSDART